jgi:hypothetical protein
MKRKKGTGETVVSLSVPRSCVSCVVCSEIIHDPHRVLCPCARSFCKACVEERQMSGLQHGRHEPRFDTVLQRVGRCFGFRAETVSEQF